MTAWNMSHLSDARIGDRFHWICGLTLYVNFAFWLFQSMNAVMATQETPSDTKTVEDVRMEVQLSASQTLIAQPIEMRWVLSVPNQTTIEFPTTASTLGDWEVVEVRDIKDIPNGSKRLWTRIWTLETLKVGEQVIPSMDVTYRTPSGTGSVSSPIQKVQVLASLPDSAKLDAPRDLPDALSIESSNATSSWNRGWWALGATIPLGLFGLAWWWRGRRRKMSPLTWATRELQSLPTQSELAGAEQFATKLSSTLRRYLEMRFQFLAEKQTSDECLRALQERSLIPADVSEGFQRVFDLADLAKFAGHRMTPESMNQEIIRAVDLVRRIDPIQLSIEESAS